MWRVKFPLLTAARWEKGFAFIKDRERTKGFYSLRSKQIYAHEFNILEGLFVVNFWVLSWLIFLFFGEVIKQQGQLGWGLDQLGMVEDVPSLWQGGWNEINFKGPILPKQFCDSMTLLLTVMSCCAQQISRLWPCHYCLTMKLQAFPHRWSYSRPTQRATFIQSRNSCKH